VQHGSQACRGDQRPGAALATAAVTGSVAASIRASSAAGGRSSGNRRDRISRAPGRVIRRIAGDTGAAATWLAATRNPTATFEAGSVDSPAARLSGSSAVVVVSREWVGAVRVRDRPDAATGAAASAAGLPPCGGSRCLVCSTCPTSRAS
jgi:hypothetical protein